MIEFIVEEVPIKESDDRWSLIGRCITDIYMGATFANATLIANVYDAKQGVYVRTRVDEFAVSLTIEQILSWGNEWNEVSAGMAAKLLVRGDASRISDRILLSSSPVKTTTAATSIRSQQ